MKSVQPFGLRVWHAIAVLVLAFGCDSEPKMPGQACEEDDECSPDLKCLIQPCSEGAFVRFCSIECQSSIECKAFSRPSCEYLGGLEDSCIEEGHNPCAQSP